MNIRRIIIVIFALLLLSLSTSVAAQEAPVTRYDRTEYNLLWRGFSNPAAMASLQGKVISTADLSARNSLGSLCGVQESPMAVYAKISTATLARLSDKVAFSGGMFFNYNYGQNMGGPVMMDPSYNPVNFYESSDETRGVKVKELYGVNAKFAYTVAPAWTIGIGFDYEGGNMAKRKDPRYRNFWMDLKASLGFTFNPSESFAVGLSGMFRKTNESLTCGNFGFNERQYFTFIDYGVGIGISESIEGLHNYIGDSSSRPMVNYIYGGALQLHFGTRVKNDHEVSFLRREGYYGENRSTDPKFTEHNGMSIAYKGQIDIASGEPFHRIGIVCKYTTLNCFKNEFTYTTSSANVTTVVYTGQRESLIRSDIEANISYEALWKKSGDIYLWSAGAVADFGLRNMEGQFYPFYHTQNRLAASLSLWGQLNIDLGSSSILITNARLGFLIGGGTAYETGQYASGSSAVLKQYDTYIRPQFEYETAPQGSVALKIGWNKTVSEKFSFTLSLSDNVKFLVTEPQYLKGKVRNILMLSFGCNF